MTAPDNGEKLPDWEAIADAVEGTSDSLAAIAERYGVPEEDIDGKLAEVNTENCPGCGWWWETCDFDADGFCIDCQGDDDA